MILRRRRYIGRSSGDVQAHFVCARPDKIAAPTQSTATSVVISSRHIISTFRQNTMYGLSLLLRTTRSVLIPYSNNNDNMYSRVL